MEFYYLCENSMSYMLAIYIVHKCKKFLNLILQNLMTAKLEFIDACLKKKKKIKNKEKCWLAKSTDKTNLMQNRK